MDPLKPFHGCQINNMHRIKEIVLSQNTIFFYVRQIFCRVFFFETGIFREVFSIQRWAWRILNTGVRSARARTRGKNPLTLYSSQNLQLKFYFIFCNNTEVFKYIEKRTDIIVKAFRQQKHYKRLYINLKNLFIWYGTEK